MRGLAFALLLLVNLAQARPVQAESLGGEYFSHAAQTYGVNAKVLMAIAWHESHFCLGACTATATAARTMVSCKSIAEIFQPWV